MMIGIIGTGGHAKVILDIFQNSNRKQLFEFFTSSRSNIDPIFHAYAVYKDQQDILLQSHSRIKKWHVAIGNPLVRKSKIEFLQSYHRHVISAIHRQAILANDIHIGEGTSIMAGAVVNPSVHIGTGCIINTTVSLDHDCLIGEYVNIGPGSKLAGGVQVGSLTELGTGAIVIPNKTIGKKCIIAAGAVVVNNIPDGSIAMGVPAKVVAIRSP
ncbi:acetyltransferase [Kroppenstedtia eburnea]|nr:acetyltransferase [Kroppenstedtia eburnea]